MYGFVKGEGEGEFGIRTEFRLVHNQKETCHYDLIPLNLIGIRNRSLSVRCQINRIKV